MLGTLLTAAALVAPGPDVLEQALARFRALDSYRVTLHAYHADGEEHMRYAYRKPGLVRMEFVRPHTGAVLIYDPATRRARLWPFGVGHFPQLDLSPDNPLIRSPRGQRVDKSDVGALLDNVNDLRQHGTLAACEETKLHDMPVQHCNVHSDGSYAVSGVYRYELWLDATTLFPRQVVSHDAQDAVIETVRMEAPELDPTLPADLFAPAP